MRPPTSVPRFAPYRQPEDRGAQSLTLDAEDSPAALPTPDSGDIGDKTPTDAEFLERVARAVAPAFEPVTSDPGGCAEPPRDANQKDER
jgi:hypothetical protein